MVDSVPVLFVFCQFRNKNAVFVPELENYLVLFVIFVLGKLMISGDYEKVRLE